MEKDRQENRQTRRDFLKTGAVAATSALAGFSIVRSASAQGAARFKVGLIGCGGRGSGAAENCLKADPGVRLVALADLFQDRIDDCRAELGNPSREDGALPGFQVKDEMCFTGFDAFKRLLETDVDIVILATPPHFRPEHFTAAVEAGKHVFTEKPVGVDPVGIRKFMAAGEQAKAKGLSVVAGTQRRHDPAYLEMIKRIGDGQIGEIRAARCYWNMGGLWKKDRKPEWSDMEWQLRNWLYFTWLSGDHIVEQHVHNIDVINWAMGTHPVKAYGMGGRQVRTDPVYGQIYDHFAIDFQYPNGVHLMSMCRQQANTDTNIGEEIVGAVGEARTGGQNIMLVGSSPWRYRGPKVNPYDQEHIDLLESIRKGEPLNEAQNVAESTLTAIMGRQSAYTGLEVNWDEFLASDLDLSPGKYEFGPMPVPPVAMPGVKTS
ncbi:MAG: Gfo/Idh/MocA family oxidoreductase [Candidatus Glassbacteria bacterium]|nr:Gfo/Idh/MocA family oxidoreductase [Candidatus Glassbacteria bacterium]